MITYKQYNFCRKIGLPPIPHVERYFSEPNITKQDLDVINVAKDLEIPSMSYYQDELGGNLAMNVLSGIAMALGSPVGIFSLGIRSAKGQFAAAVQGLVKQLNYIFNHETNYQPLLRLQEKYKNKLLNFMQSVKYQKDKDGALQSVWQYINNLRGDAYKLYAQAIRDYDKQLVINKDNAMKDASDKITDKFGTKISKIDDKINSGLYDDSKVAKLLAKKDKLASKRDHKIIKAKARIGNNPRFYQ